MRKRMLVAVLCGLVGLVPAVAQDVKKSPGGYAEAWEAVQKGATVYVAVGGAVAQPGDFVAVETPMKSAAGRYKAWKKEDGTPWFEPVDDVRPASVRPLPAFGFQLTGPFGNTVGVCVGRS